MKTVRIGIVGYGTVGQATADILHAHAAEIERRSGAQIVVTVVCRRSPVTTPVPGGSRIETDWRHVVDADDVDIVVETMGGTSVAREVVAAALSRGKPVVTANKNLLAAHGEGLFRLAAQHHRPLGFEASVAGGVPVVRAIAEGTAGDRLIAIFGILNGTANYILTRMEAAGLDFTEALAEAQAAGYAEADPTFDVEGFDARDKLAILTRLAFGSRVLPDKIPTFGITRITAVDLLYARRLESTIRLVGAAELHNGQIEVSVRPWLVHHSSMLAKVDGVNNAVFLQGERVGTQMFYGRGAGGNPTGIAVVSDLIEIAADFAAGKLAAKTAPGFCNAHDLPISLQPHPVPWYLRLTIRDRPGIVARIAEIIAREGINIDSVLQEPHMAKDALSFVITVEPVSEPVIHRAVAAINSCDFLQSPVLLLRVQSPQ